MSPKAKVELLISALRKEERKTADLRLDKCLYEVRYLPMADKRTIAFYAKTDPEVARLQELKALFARTPKGHNGGVIGEAGQLTP